ncbi:MAG: dienelactone hydrolase family protein [Bacteroidota bacterium]
MKKYIRLFVSLLFAICLNAGITHAQNSIVKKNIKLEKVTYTSGSTNLIGYVAYDSLKKGKRPAVVVVPEWWGNNDYAKTRAKMLAELGYIAIAADMYGDGKVATDPTKAQEYATPFYQDPQLGKDRIEAAVDKLKEYTQTDSDKMAAIGYCFGGAMVLNAAKMGSELKGVVSFHGGLNGVEATDSSMTTKILVCHGSADKSVSDADVKKFKNNLDSLGVPYTFIVYPGATHAFTNPAATGVGKKFKMPIKYNAVADKKSWNDMRVFLKKIFK